MGIFGNRIRFLQRLHLHDALKVNNEDDVVSKPAAALAQVAPPAGPSAHEDAAVKCLGSHALVLPGDALGVHFSEASFTSINAGRCSWMGIMTSSSIPQQQRAQYDGCWLAAIQQIAQIYSVRLPACK
jgi:hypothetical protein